VRHRSAAPKSKNVWKTRVDRIGFDVNRKKPFATRYTTIPIPAVTSGKEAEAGIFLALQKGSLHRATMGPADQNRSTRGCGTQHSQPRVI